jgi:CrcB protein
VTTPSVASALLVGVGGAVGALARFCVGTVLPGERSTFAVNTLGSLALGVLVAVGVSGDPALIAGTGFCGAFTTFSSFAVEVVDRYGTGDRAGAARYAALTLLSALAGVGSGAWLAGVLAG